MTLPPMAQFLQFFYHHMLLFSAVGVALALFIANELYGIFSAGPRLSAPQAVRLINDREALVLDIRSAADFKKSHLLGALNIPAAKLKERASELAKYKERPVIVYCSMGSTSPEAAKTLRTLGHSEVHPLRGGINGWINSNLPVTAK